MLNWRLAKSAACLTPQSDWSDDGGMSLWSFRVPFAIEWHRHGCILRHNASFLTLSHSPLITSNASVGDFDIPVLLCFRLSPAHLPIGNAGRPPLTSLAPLDRVLHARDLDPTPFISIRLRRYRWWVSPPFDRSRPNPPRRVNARVKFESDSNHFEAKHAQHAPVRARKERDEANMDASCTS